jgi:hypothetical protein
MKRKKKLTYTHEDDRLDREAIERYMKMTPEERHRAIEEEKKRWDSLTDEEKDRECLNG